MKVLYKYGLTIFIVIVVICALVSPASAQSGDVCFEVTFGGSLHAGCYAWESYSNTLTIDNEGDCVGSRGSESGGNLEGTFIECGGTGLDQDLGYVAVTLPDGCVLVSWSVPYKVDIGDLPDGARISSYSWHTSETTAAAAHFDAFDTGGSFASFVSSGGAYPATGLDFIGFVVASGSYGGDTGQVAFDYVQFVCEEGSIDPPSSGTYGGPFQPIAEELQVEVVTPRNISGMVNGASRITAETSSAMLGATPVYASISGTIGNVTPNSIELLGEVNGEEWEVLYRNLETIYVEPGDTVDAGCIIALAAPITSETTESESTDLKGLSFRIINLDLESFEDWELFSSPSGTRVCGSLVKGESCLNANPYLNDHAAIWNVTPSDTGLTPQRGEGWVSLFDNQSMFQYVALDSGETYYVTIAARMLDVPVGGRSALLRVTLGDSFNLHSIYADLPGDIPKGNPAPGEEQVFVVGPFEPTTADLSPDLYKLSIANNAALSKVAITYVCLSESDTATIAPYSSCYFERLGDFSTTGETMHDALGTEFIALDDTETITYEDLTLSGYDDAGAVYDVEVMVSTSDEDQSSATATSSPELTLSFNDGTEYAVDDTITIPYYARRFNMVTFTIEIPEDEIVTADLIIAHDQQASTDSEFIYVSNICLIAPTGWPGYDSAPPGDGGSGGGGSGGGGSGSCAPIVAPFSTDVWAWIVWLFDSLTRLIKCVLPGELLKILNAILSVIDLITDIGRWLAAVFQLLGEWTFSLITWAINTAMGLVGGFIELIWNALVGLPILQWLYDISTLAPIIFDLIVALASGLLTLVLNAIRTLATFANIVSTMFGYIIAGFNASTTVETGLPASCETIVLGDTWYPYCGVLDLIEYIFTQFPVFLAPIAVLFAALAYFAFLKTIVWTGEAFAEVG
jgi:hypothetical protein